MKSFLDRAFLVTSVNNGMLRHKAGVITNADGLTDFEMQKIARELNNSETAFIFSSNSIEYNVHILSTIILFITTILCLKFKANQEEAIKMAGIIEVKVKIEDKEPVVPGNAIIVFKSKLVLND